MAIYVTGISTPELHLESPPLLGTLTPFGKLPGCRERLRRAQEHLNLLDTEFHQFDKSFVPHKACSLRLDVDRKTGDQALYLVVHELLRCCEWSAQSR